VRAHEFGFPVYDIGRALVAGARAQAAAVAACGVDFDDFSEHNDSLHKRFQAVWL
jgi:hypothetical protein